jgi:hypothetical protein
MKIIAHKEPWSSRVGLVMLSEDGKAAAINVTFKSIENGEYVGPADYLSQNDAQALMDSLWSAGLRPSEGSGSASALAATQRHLDDMRSLVFKERSA